jgi:hypothetical protein
MLVVGEFFQKSQQLGAHLNNSLLAHKPTNDDDNDDWRSKAKCHQYEGCKLGHGTAT